MRFGDSNPFDLLYSGSAKVGKIHTWINGIVVIVIAVCFIFLGIYLISTPATFPDNVEFTVKSVTPFTRTIPASKNNTARQETVYNLTGTVPSCGSNVVILDNYNTFVNVGDIIPAYIKPKCSQNIASESSGSSRGIGFGILIVSVIVLLLIVSNLFLVTKHKGYAAYQGAQLLGRNFRI